MLREQLDGQTAISKKIAKEKEDILCRPTTRIGTQ